MRWALGINGALSVAFGVIIIIWPSISLYALTILFGAFVTASGVVGLGALFSGSVKEEKGWLAVSSVLSLVVGIAVLVWPNISALALLYVIGFYAIAFGVITIGGAFWLPLSGGDTAWLSLTGLVSIVFGIVMLVKPGDGALVLLALIAAYSLVAGITQLVFAIDGKRMFERRARQLRTSAVTG
jgi:uncharacterized membrane protein HdeD (DUF308 family)